MLLWVVIGVGFENICAVSGKWLFQDFMDEYIKYNTLQHKSWSSVVLKTPGIHSEVTQLDSRQWSVFNSRLSKFVLEGSWDIKFVILVENFNTDYPSSITVKKEFLFAFNSDLAWATNGGGGGGVGGRKHCFVIFLFGGALLVDG